ncbi:hypothetical protein [Paracoccus spongiarum]|uniref:DNA breaking-rejoining protein n=1 Tax=Paracoccus spongiarum TaxID=3064387 RepID=A0ABT9JCR5_9RHOB|nr:hypothetical protein [Paracoccus sp. 2205BS29-5]MDP5307559.1 hypothetical protein [Paracoccus sp. 2205BS29-5]
MLKTLLLVAATTLPLAATAQTTETVTFKPGNYGTMVTGSITGDGYADYRIGAKAGQELFAELAVAESSGDGSIYFNLLPPGSADVAIYNASMDGNSATIPLPRDGTYTIRVYHMGNDEDSGATTSFNLDLSIQ